MKKYFIVFIAVVFVAGCGLKKKEEGFSGVTEKNSYVAQGFEYLQKSDIANALRSFDLAIKKDRMFRQNAFTVSLRTHKLKGPLDGYWAYSVNLEYRVLFRFINNHEVLYYDIGTHEIYH